MNIFDDLDAQQDAVKSLTMSIRHHGCATPLAGRFYRTFNESIVFVFAPKTHYDYEKRFFCVVIEGGHPYMDERGSEVGDQYQIDTDGSVHMQQDTNLLKCPLMLGMTLRKQICTTQEMPQ